MHDLTTLNVTRSQVHQLEITDFPTAKTPPDYFNEYFNLESLLINGEKLHKFYPNYLSDSKNTLKSLSLKNTKISNLKWLQKSKTNLNNLSEFRVTHSQLGTCHGMCAKSSSFRPFLFKNDLPSVLILDFSFNHIKLIATQAFDDIPLDVLDLSNNKLGFGYREKLDFIHHAKYVNLGYNFFFDVPKLSEFSSRLEKISLAGNHLEYLIEKNFKDKGYHNILELDVSDTHLSFLDSQWHLHVPHLKILDISHNHFKNITTGQIPYCNDNCLRELYAHNNHDMTRFLDVPSSLKILTVFSSALRFIDFEHLQETTHEKALYMQDNPWSCDCELGQFFESFEGQDKFHPEFNKLGEMSRCFRGYEVGGRQISENVTKMRLDMQYFNCPQDGTLAVILKCGLISSSLFVTAIIVMYIFVYFILWWNKWMIQLKVEKKQRLQRAGEKSFSTSSREPSIGVTEIVGSFFRRGTIHSMNTGQDQVYKMTGLWKRELSTDYLDTEDECDTMEHKQFKDYNRLNVETQEDRLFRKFSKDISSDLFVGGSLDMVLNVPVNKVK